MPLPILRENTGPYWRDQSLNLKMRFRYRRIKNRIRICYLLYRSLSTARCALPIIGYVGGPGGRCFSREPKRASFRTTYKAPRLHNAQTYETVPGKIAIMSCCLNTRLDRATTSAAGKGRLYSSKVGVCFTWLLLEYYIHPNLSLGVLWPWE